MVSGEIPSCSAITVFHETCDIPQGEKMVLDIRKE